MKLNIFAVMLLFSVSLFGVVVDVNAIDEMMQGNVSFQVGHSLHSLLSKTPASLLLVVCRYKMLTTKMVVLP
jgi:hypothetical protein